MWLHDFFLEDDLLLEWLCLVAVIIVAVGFHHVPVLPVHDVLILDIHGHMFDHVTSVMCIHVLSQSVVFAPIFVQIAVVFSTVFVRVMIAVWLITIMRIAIMARVGIPMPCAMKIVAIPVRSMTINLMARMIIITATVIMVVLDHNFFHLLVDVVVAVILLSDVAVMLIMIFVVAAR